MSSPFRQNHLFQILHSFDSTGIPLDGFLRNYFRAHKSVGSKDRRYIADTVYDLIRWRGLLDALSSLPPTWENRLQTLQHNPPFSCRDLSLAPHLRASFPKVLFELLAKHYGETEALSLCLASNTAAPTTIRVNPLKTTREALLQKWAPLYSASPTVHSQLGIHLQQKINFFSLAEFKEGLFEVQDEASQLVSSLVKAGEGQQVLDYCAGSGGKTLAFAPGMNGKGQIHLHDIRPFILGEAKKRLRRAGIQNAQILNAEDRGKKNNLKRRMDWVLCDVPCSGSGTLRRNPDMKWKFTLDMLERLIAEQRKIFQEALEFLRPGGKIVYATCSIFPDENDEQIAFFQKEHGLCLAQEPFRSLPKKGGMDGFFGAVLQKI